MTKTSSHPNHQEMEPLIITLCINLRMRIPVPINWTYSWLKLFHGKSQCVMVPSKSRKSELERRGFKNVAIWSRGVDTKIFNNDNPFPYQLPRPIHIYMGRVALEKNISSFLELKLEGSKIVIGDGPDLKHLSSIYTETHFLGVKRGRELASYLSSGDVFVFPSKTDTFGIVMLEAMACGLPILLKGRKTLSNKITAAFLTIIFMMLFLEH